MQVLPFGGDCSMEVPLLQNTDQDSVTEAILFIINFLFLNLYVSHNFIFHDETHIHHEYVYFVQYYPF